MNHTVIRLSGGMGNQLFQFSTAYAYSVKFNKILVIDYTTGFSNDVFKRKYELEYLDLKNYGNVKKMSFLYKMIFNRVSYSLFRYFYQKFNLFNNFIFIENENSFQASLFSKTNLFYIEGYFQSYFYFHSFKNVLHKIIFPNVYYENKHFPVNNKLKIAIHIRQLRQFDSLGNKVTNLESRGLPLNYYTTALNYISNKYQNFHIYIFGDNPNWFKENFPNFNETDYTLFNNILSNGLLHDMLAIKNCDVLVLSNSTFSWWPGWLSDKAKEIIVPPIYYWDNVDILPKEWKVIDDFN